MSNRGGHATFNGCVRLDTSGTRPQAETVRAAYSPCHVYLTIACVLPLAGFPEMATSIAGWASTSWKCNPKMPGASSFSKTCSYHVPSTLARQQQFSWLRIRQEPLPRGLWTNVATTTSRPPSNRDVAAPEGAWQIEGAAPTTPPGGVIDSIRQGSIVQSGRPLQGPGQQRWQVLASRTVPRARTSLGRQRAVFSRAAGGRSGGPGGRTRCALPTSYAFGDDTIGSRGLIATVTRTAGPRAFRGAGL